MLPSHLSNHLQQLLFSVQNKIQSPLALSVNSMLAAMSTSMQDFLIVEQPIGIQTPVSLYLMAIAESGERKTTTDKIFAQPIYTFEQTMLVDDQKQLKLYGQEHELWKMKLKEAKRHFTNAIRRQLVTQEQLEKTYKEAIESEPQLPLTNKRIFSDSTIESLLFELSRSRTGGLFMSTEAGNILSRITTNFTSNLNSLWDGDSISIDRKSSHSFILENKSLTCAFMLQPSVLEQIMKTKETLSRGSGLLARFLVCKPESTQGTRFIQQTFQNFHLVDFHERIAELLGLSSQFRAMNKTEVLSFDGEASQRWIQCANNIEARIAFNGELSDIKDCASKAMNNISRIAALLHYYEYGYKNDQESHNKLIGRNNLEAAIKLVESYTYQFKGIFGEKTVQEKAWDYGVLLYNYLAKNYTLNAIYIKKDWLYRNGPKQIRKQDKLDLAIDTLINNGYLELQFGSKPVTYVLTLKFLQENNLEYWVNGFANMGT